MLRLLGEVSAEVDGRPVDLGTPRQRCVLAALAVDAGQVVSVGRLVDRVWGGDAAPRARATLHGYVSRLRRALAEVGGLAIVRRAGNYGLVTCAAESVDLQRFRHLCAVARADEVVAVRAFTEALALWRGEALAGLAGEWVRTERELLAQERLSAEHDLVEARLRAGEGVELVAELSARVARHPLDERVAGQYLVVLHRAGRTADALAHYRQVRARLVEELGAEPGVRLQEAHQQVLTAGTASAGVLASSAAEPVVPRQLPAAPALFTGRVTELAELDRLLTPPHGARGAGATVVISTIGGTGGIGKTWLALTWANRNLHHFPDGQLAVDLRGFGPGEPRQAADVLAGFLTALGVDRDCRPHDPDARAALYRGHTAGRRMLILLDNAASPGQVTPLLPGGDSCTVLVTSRHRLPALLTRHGAQPVHLDVLTDTEARALLVAAVGESGPGTLRAVTELIGLCRGFPLALGVVAARVRAHPGLLGDIVTELRDLGLDALDSDDPAVSLPTVLSWSLRRLTDRQRTLFALLGVAPGPDTTPSAAAALTARSPSDARGALSALEEVSLLERRPHGRYGMHDLVRDYATTTARALPDDVRDTALARVEDFHLQTAHTANDLLEPHGQYLPSGPPLPGVRPHPLPDAAAATAWLDAEHATLLATQRAATALGHHRVVWHLAWALDTFHLRRGHLCDALATWRAALDAAAHLPGPATQIDTHRLLGRACARLGLHEEGTAHLNRALGLARRHRDLTQQALTHRALAVAWGRRHDDRRALDHARQALDLFRALGRQPWEADALSSVALHAARLGHLETAHDHCRAALVLNRRHHDLEGEAITLDKFGLIAHLAGDHEQAVGHYRQALVLFRALGHTYQVANVLDDMGHPLAAAGHHDQARAVWRETLDLYREQGRAGDAERARRQLDVHRLLARATDTAG